MPPRIKKAKPSPALFWRHLRPLDYIYTYVYKHKKEKKRVDKEKDKKEKKKKKNFQRLLNI